MIGAKLTSFSNPVEHFIICANIFSGYVPTKTSQLAISKPRHNTPIPPNDIGTYIDAAGKSKKPRFEKRLWSFPE
jgi:hypothetical protein